MKIYFFLTIITITTLCYSNSFQERESIINGILKDNKPKTVNENKNIETKLQIPNKINKKTKVKKQNLMISTEDQIQLKLGINLYNGKMFNESIKTMLNLQKNYPESNFIDTSHIYTGKSYIGIYNYKKAIEHFETINKNSGEYPLALFYLGHCYKTLGQNLNSIKFYEKVSSLFPEHELADNSLLQSAKLHLQNGQGEIALLKIVKLIKFFKDRETIDDAYFFLGKIYQKDSKLKDSETAAKIFRKFLKKVGKNEKYFKNSSLTNKVKKELSAIEND